MTDTPEPDFDRIAHLNNALDKVLGEAKALMQEMRLANRLHYVKPDGTTKIYFQDHAVSVAVPMADIDGYQRRLLELRMPHDPGMITQLVDLLQTLEGRSIVDAGAFTGSLSFMLREFLKPSALHLFEPQAIIRSALEAAVAANTTKDCPIHFRADIIGEDKAEMTIAAQPPGRLSQTQYIRREGGTLHSVAIDSCECGIVGMIILDYENDKIDALRGALKTIERDKPCLLVDRNSRDEAEIVKLLEPFNYAVTGIGRTYHLFVPES